MKKTLLTLLVVFSIIPILTFAQGTGVKLDYSGLVKCDGVVTKSEGQDRGNTCDFNDLIGTFKSTISWLFFISVPLATTLFAYAGLLYMTGSPKNIGAAKEIFTSVGWGFIIMLTAWFLVVTAVNWFVKPGSGVDTFVNTSK